VKYIPATPAERDRMLQSIGARSVENLFADIPPEVRRRGPLDLPPAMADPDLLAHARRLDGRNADCDRVICFLGAGAYDHFVPSTVAHLALKPEFLTAYTPYQPRSCRASCRRSSSIKP
jgi:glycine dehydrogenase subunit 1